MITLTPCPLSETFRQTLRSITTPATFAALSGDRIRLRCTSQTLTLYVPTDYARAWLESPRGRRLVGQVARAVCGGGAEVRVEVRR